MKPHTIVITGALVLFITFVTLPDAYSQPTASDIITNWKKEAARIKDYEANMNINVNIPGVSVPTMKAKVYYKAPDKIHYDSDGFAMIPKEALAINPQAFDDSMFDMVIQGEETISDALCYKVKLLANSDTIPVQRAALYIDRNHWILRKATIDPNIGNSADVKIDYTLVKSTYFLPSRFEVSMDAPNFKNWGKDAVMNPDKPKKKSKITVTYTNYKVNKGIPDSVFEEEEKK